MTMKNVNFLLPFTTITIVFYSCKLINKVKYGWIGCWDFSVHDILFIKRGEFQDF